MTGEQAFKLVFNHDFQSVNPHALTSKLSQVWKEFQASQSDVECVRLCSHNLLIVLTEPSLIRKLPHELDELLLNYPGRVVVAILDAEHSGDPEGAYKLYTRRGQLAGELVAVHLGQDGSPLPSMVAPLWQDGLPLVTIFQGAPPYGSGWFGQLVENCTRLVIDTGQQPAASPDDVVAPLLPFWKLSRDPYLAPQAFSDFSWGRLYIWRDWIASLFDRPDRRRLLPFVQAVEIEVWSRPGEHVPSMQALYLGAWLVSQLGWSIDGPLHETRGAWEVQVNGFPVRFYTRATEDADKLGRAARVTFSGVCDEQPVRLSVERDSNDGSTLVLGASGPGCTSSGHTLHLESMDNLTLIGHQLEATGRDLAYERVLETLLTMTGHLEKAQAHS